MRHHTWLIFVFLVEMGFHHVGQDGHELLTSSDPLTSASQSAGITSVSNHPWWHICEILLWECLHFSVPILDGQFAHLLGQLTKIVLPLSSFVATEKIT